MDSINEYRLTYYDLPPIELSQIWIHFAHRLGALLATGFVIWNATHILRTYAVSQMRELAIVQMLLVVVQFLLGALTVWTGKGVQIATAHVATGALLLGTSVALAFLSYGLFRVTASESVESRIPEWNPSKEASPA
jgi:heme A synthase